MHTTKLSVIAEGPIFCRPTISPAKWPLRGGVGFPRRYLVRLGEFDDTCG
jgi:hypothetical protein